MFHRMSLDGRCTLTAISRVGKLKKIYKRLAYRVLPGVGLSDLLERHYQIIIAAGSLFKYRRALNNHGKNNKKKAPGEQFKGLYEILIYTSLV